MDNKLYVGNLSYSTNELGLQTLFGQAGTVTSVQIIKDRETGRSKGFGFVEMSTEEEAQKAISLFNEKEIDGRQLKVNIARPRGSSERRRRRPAEKLQQRLQSQAQEQPRELLIAA